MRRNTIFRFLAATMLAVFCLSVAASVSPKASAAATGFSAGHVIDDAIFTNSNSMTADAIQNFLAAKQPNCDTNGNGTISYRYNSSTGRMGNAADGYVTTSRNIYGQRYNSFYGVTYASAPYVCLAGLIMNPTTGQSNLQNPSAQVDGGQSAGQLIYNAARAYNINPQVLIITLQKEQGLVTDDWPWVNQYRAAMGFNCPDTPQGCSGYAGFTDQLYSSAKQYRNYLNNPNNFNYVVGNNRIYYAPIGQCSASSTVYIQNQATAALYDYTPYQPNDNVLSTTNPFGSSAGPGPAVAGDSCAAYGLRNFWWFFNSWFGNSLLPYAFQGPNDPRIYIYVSGYKVVVPAMGVLQDYGISPGSIVNLDQSTFNSIPTPGSGSGVSPNISYIIKTASDSDADGGSLYYVSVGRKYAFTSMQQFSDFGFSQQDITYEPLEFIVGIPGNQALSNFILSPTNSVFRVAGGRKQLILNYQTFRALNPSDVVTPVSHFGANLVPSSSPLSNTPVLVRQANSSAVSLLLNGTYYGIPTFDIYSCWGFEGTLNTQLYTIPDISYASAITPGSNLNCLNTDGSGNTFLLSGNTKYSIPGAYGISRSPAINSELVSLQSGIPTNSTPLKQYIKGSSTAAVWYLNGGVRRMVPTYNNYVLLGLDQSKMTVVDNSALVSIPANGIKLGDGTLVKSTSGSAVYAVFGDSLIQYTTSDNFLAYGNNWDSIESYDQATLSQYYPASSTTVTNYLYVQPSTSLYLVDPNGCYQLNTSLQTSYNKTASSVSTSQGYASSIFPSLNLSKCTSASVYVKSPTNPIVYWIDGGTKHPVSGWNKLVQHSGTSNPYIITISDNALQTFTTSSTL